MRILVILIFLSFSMNAFTQALITPGSTAIQSRWITEETSRMNWYVMRGNEKLLLGNVLTQFSKKDKQLMMITTVKMKQFTALWTDTSIAEFPSLKPVYHSSHNSQRDMALSFGKIVTGYYYDLVKKENIVITDTTRSPYFDSNIYPAVIRWLPLTEGYNASVAIYDYNPEERSAF
jgi:hypothetical protein